MCNFVKLLDCDNCRFFIKSKEEVPGAYRKVFPNRTAEAAQAR